MNRIQQVLSVMIVASALVSCARAPVKNPVTNTKKAEINTQLGVEYLRKGMHEASLQKLEKALKQDSRHAPAHDAIAVLYERLGENDKADSHYKRSLSLDGKNAATLNNYGQYLCRQNKLDKADAHFLKAVENPLYRYPEMIYTNAGICAGRVPDQRKAEGYFRKALAKNAAYAPALKEMIRLSFTQDNYLGARAYLQRYETKGPLDAKMLWVAVQTEKHLGDKDAMAKYKLLLKNKFPDSAQATELRKWENERSH
ncbi:MAG: type IV pilus biogenesis/stability protein PilW [Gammaproteobacteria bacterium]